MRKKIGLIKKLSVFQFLKYRNSNIVTGKKFYPYAGSCFQIEPSAKIQIDGSLHFNSGKIGNSRAEGYIRMDKNAVFRVSGDFNFFYGCDIAVYEGAQLTIGSGYINSGGQIRCAKSIYIGNDVAIGRNFFVQDSDFHTIEDEKGNASEDSIPIVIEDKVWIGANVTVLKGVHIGEGAVIGAGTIVTKDVPAHSVVAGTPNRILRENIRWK